MTTSGLYGTTIENCHAAKDKATQKKDGAYSYRGLIYVVKDGKITHFAAYGSIYFNAGAFLVFAGSYKHFSDGAANKREVLRLCR